MKKFLALIMTALLISLSFGQRVPDCSDCEAVLETAVEAVEALEETAEEEKQRGDHYEQEAEEQSERADKCSKKLDETNKRVFKNSALIGGVGIALFIFGFLIRGTLNEM